jgi:DNA mismatch repair protein MutS
MIAPRCNSYGFSHSEIRNLNCYTRASHFISGHPMSEQSTPLMRQHADIKKQHPSALLFFRVGDFYELFFDDAVTAARELQITLTSRQKDKGGIAIPMCGVPYHAAENYIARLIRKGYKVAICDQVEDPKLTKKLVRREVTRVVTPGTAVDSQLGSEENNFLAAIVRQHDVIGFAALDLSTGDFRATEFRDTSGSQADSDRRAQEELFTLRAREVLYPLALPLFRAQGTRTLATSGEAAAATRTAPVSTLGIAETPLEDWVFAADYAVPLVENHFGVISLEGFGLANHRAAACAAGAILHYIKQTQRGTLTHVDRIGYYERQQCLVLDSVTTRNLELVEPLLAGTSDDITLFRAIDNTCTPMGKRLLRSWMLRPSINVTEINARLDAVQSAIRATIDREELRRGMEGILDIERLLSKVTLEAANPRDVLALAASFARLPNVKTGAAKLASDSTSPDGQTGRWHFLGTSLDELADLRERIETSIIPEPPLTLSDGGVIASGLDKELDELRDLSRNGKQYIAQIEQRERERTGIGSLKIKFNNVFGFYIEISKSNLDRAPSDYERKQTLVGAERFTTPELKEYEQKVLSAEEKIVEIEKRIFGELRVAIASEARRIRQSAMMVAEIDVLASFGHLAAIRNYCRPTFDDTGDLEIVSGRHPVIEQPDLTGSNERFVPNDLYLNAATHNVLLITGPNMGGKSTYLRQTALIVLMAQMGSFVPATRARLTVVDRIFTRIGAADNLARGRSTFMVEMTETAAILNTATSKSLILLDEIGRGTATYDGLAIAWAVVEFIHARTKAKTLFATHYHELTELESLLDSVKNFHVSVKETGGNIVFMRKVEKGAADKSYGIEVAKLAGLPNDVIVRAREVLHEHETAEQRATEHLSGDNERERPMQLTIFTPLSNTIVDQLRDADLNRLTPIEALNLLHELKKQID